MIRTGPNQYEADQEPIVISKTVMDLFLKNKNEKPGDLIALYLFYYYTAKWQKTNRVRASIEYVATGLKLGEQKVRRIKKELVRLNLIEDIHTKNNQGQLTGHYVLVKFIWKDETIKNHPVDSTRGGEKTTLLILPPLVESHPNALSAVNINALSVVNKKLKEKADRIIRYLNKTTGKKFKERKTTREHIVARLKDGFTYQDCKKVITNKSQDQYFIDNPKYMNPETLFRPSKFEIYLNSTPKQPKEAPGNKRADQKYGHLTKIIMEGGVQYHKDSPDLPPHIKKQFEELAKS